MIAVRAIVVRPLTEIEDLVSRQAVSVLVEFHLAAGGVCKVARMTADLCLATLETRHSAAN